MRQTLTKSLHTVTAVVNVAQFIAQESCMASYPTEDLVQMALSVLGHTGYLNSDPVVSRCIAVLNKELGR